MLNALFGTKFKVVNGYKGTAEIHKAMETGEVQGVGAANWTSLLSFDAELGEREEGHDLRAVCAEGAYRPS